MWAYQRMLGSASTTGPLAKDLGLTGTPVYVVGGTILKGAVGSEKLTAQIALARGKN
ncbi:DsbA family protein [Rhizobium sp. RAF56]|jgi:protein-disulfide isomerase|uniref:DsbA family protein n=1 Tax=Rhizobium sp. RAF56 TaxID=3233062 RepID=UPI003F98C0DE